MEGILAKLARDHTEHLALIQDNDETRSVTYEALDSQVRQLRDDFFQCGVSRGSVVAVVFPNSLEVVLVFLALLTCEATIAPLNPQFKADEYAYYIKDADAEFAIASEATWAAEGGLTSAVQSLPCAPLECSRGEQEILRIRPGGMAKATGQSSKSKDTVSPTTAVILHTSGTTGKPKRVPLTLENLLASTENVLQAYSLQNSDRTVLIMPLFHIHGIVAGLLAPLLSGAGLVILTNGVSADFWEAFTQHEATWWTATPTHQKMILNLPRAGSKSKLRFIRSCSSALSPQDLKKLEDAFDVPVLQAYAMTENAHHISSHVDDKERKPGSVGYPSINVDVVIVDNDGQRVAQGEIGEIAIRGKSTMLGYLGNAEANAKAFTGSGHFRTGDQGYFDEDGSLFLTGRLKEMINKGGESLSPVELDSVFLTNAKVSEAVSFAVPDETYGEDIGVAVVVAEGQSLTEHDLIRWLKEKVTTTELPKSIWFVSAIPKTATGKLQRLAVAKTMLETDAKVDSHAPSETGDGLEDFRKMWSEVLRIPVADIKDTDKFSALSGDSGLAIRLVGIARSRGYSLSVATVFEHNELTAMAEHAARSDEKPESPDVQLEQPEAHIVSLCAKALDLRVDDIEDAYPMTPFQSHMAAENLGTGTWVTSYCFHCRNVSFEHLKEVLEVLQQRHTILRAHTLHIDGRFYQVVTRNGAELENLTKAETYLDDMRGKPLPLSGRAFRLAYAANESPSPVLILTLGHVIMDEWSRALLFQELDLGLKNLEELRNSPGASSFGPFARWISSLVDDISAPISLDSEVGGKDPRQDEHNLCTLQSQVDLPTDLPSTHPWSVYAHLAWALTLSSRNTTQRSQTAVTTVQNGRTAPFPSIQSLVGPTLTLVNLAINISPALPLSQSLKQISDNMLAPDNSSFAGSNLYHQRYKTWILNCATAAPLDDVHTIGAEGEDEAPRLELDQSMSDRVPPGFGVKGRVFQSQGGLEVRMVFDGSCVGEADAEEVLGRFEGYLRRVCGMGKEGSIEDVVGSC